MPARQRRRVGPAEAGGIREGPPCEGATIQDSPPAFDQVQPGSAGRQAMAVEPWMPKVPQQALGAGVDGAVIDDHVDRSCRNPCVHLLHQLNERGAVPALAHVEQPPARRRDECPEAPHGASASILRLVMRPMSGFRPLPLGRIALRRHRPRLIHTEHAAPRRRGGVATDNSPLFSGNSGAAEASQRVTVATSAPPPGATPGLNRTS